MIVLMSNSYLYAIATSYSGAISSTLIVSLDYISKNALLKESISLKVVYVSQSLH